MTRTTLSRRLASEISTLRNDFASFATTFAALAIRRAHFAPTFLATFKRYERETSRTFVAFVRELDPAMPVAREEYPRSRSYQAALYLRRLAEAEHTVAGKRKRQTVTPFDLLASMIRSVIVLMRPDEDEIWRAVAEASRWHERDLKKLRVAVAKAHYFVLPGAPRLVSAKAALRPNAGRLQEAS